MSQFAQPKPEIISSLAANAARWAFWLMVLRQVSTMGGTMVIARHVTPRDFGIAAMALSVVAFLVLFDTALTWATVQSPNLDRNRIDALFWLGAFVGSVLWVLSYVCSPWLAHFYHEPALRNVCTTLGAAVFMNSLSTQPAALLKRQLRQKTTNLIDTMALVLGSVVGVMLALDGHGFWSIVIQTIAYYATRTLLLFLASEYRPGHFRWPSNSLSEVRIGLGFALSNYITFFQLYLGGILVGHVFGAGPLGNYQRAYNAKSLPTAYATMVVTDVMVSSLAAVRQVPQQMSELYLKALRTTAFIACPAGAILLPLAPEVIRVLYGAQWTGAVPFLRLFAVVAIALPISTSTIWLFLAMGRAREQLKMNIVLSAISVAVLAPVALLTKDLFVLVACEATLFSGPFLFANVYFSHRATGIQISKTARAVGPIVAVSVVAAAVSWAVGEAFNEAWYVEAFLKMSVAAACYFAASFAFTRPWPSYFSKHRAVK